MTDLQLAQHHWSETLADLQHQLPKETYDQWVSATYLVSADNGHYTIAAASSFAVDWLQNRLYGTLQSALARVTGQPDVQLTFIAQASLPPSGGIEGGGEGWAGGPDWTTVPAEVLDFNPYAAGSGGYFAMSNYIQEFWGAYLGAPALQLLNFVRRFYDEPAVVFDKRAKKNIPNPNWRPWTPARNFHLNDLVRAVRGTDKRVRGCWRTCSVYAAQVAQGVVSDRCFCELRGGTGTLTLGKPLLPDHPDGRPICHFWRAGLLDTLQLEEIITVQQQGDPARPATVFFKIEVFQPLPLLAPWQIGQLPDTVQDEHRKWLSRHGFNLAAWGAIPVERLMPLIKLYPRWLRL
jgi:hypothetical protein